ncbi:MAG: FHA domain-containing protein [Kofleriaceae bacterium]
MRLRIWGTDQVHALPATASEAIIGTTDACAIRLRDASRRVSRQHARLVRDGAHWIIRDLESKNGIRIDGARRTELTIEPGVEIGIGGVTLIAETARLVALRCFLARILGWSSSQIEIVDLGLRAIRAAATRRTALVLCGGGDLVPLAQALHRHVLGEDRPFVQCDPRRRRMDASVRAAENYALGVPAMIAAAGGSVCVWSKRLPRDFEQLKAALREPGARVQLIVCSQELQDCKGFATPITIPSLATRPAELDRIIDEYGADAIASLAASGPFTSKDRQWVREHSASSLPDIEKGTRRLVALRHGGSLARAAGMLGMSHVALTEWIGRRRVLSPPK